MNDRRYTVEETAEREHDGELLVIDIATGEYSVSESELAAFEDAERKNPNGFFYVKRVGREAVHRIGGATFSGGFRDRR